MQIRSFCLVTFALRPLAALALPPAAHASSAVHERRVRAVPDCAAAMRIALPNAHITAASAVTPNDSTRALGQKPYCRVEATVDEETHIVALLPDDWNGRFLMGGAGGYVGAVQNQYESTVHEGYATVGTDAGHTAFQLTAGWALHSDRRIADYGPRAVHRTALSRRLRRYRGDRTVGQPSRVGGGVWSCQPKRRRMVRSLGRVPMIWNSVIVVIAA